LGCQVATFFQFHFLLRIPLFLAIITRTSGLPLGCHPVAIGLPGLPPPKIQSRETLSKNKKNDIFSKTEKKRYLSKRRNPYISILHNLHIISSVFFCPAILNPPVDIPAEVLFQYPISTLCNKLLERNFDSPVGIRQKKIDLCVN